MQTSKTFPNPVCSHDYNGDLQGESVAEAADDWDVEEMMSSCGEYMSGQFSE